MTTNIAVVPKKYLTESFRLLIHALRNRMVTHTYGTKDILLLKEDVGALREAINTYEVLVSSPESAFEIIIQPNAVMSGLMKLASHGGDKNGH